MSRGCDVDGCDGPHEARGLCPKHYVRWRKHGDPLHVQVPDANGLDDGENREIDALLRGERQWRYNQPREAEAVERGERMPTWHRRAGR